MDLSLTLKNFITMCKELTLKGKITTKEKNIEKELMNLNFKVSTRRKIEVPIWKDESLIITMIKRKKQI